MMASKGKIFDKDKSRIWHWTKIWHGILALDPLEVVMIRLETQKHDDDNLVEEVLFDIMNPLKPTVVLTWQQAHKTCMVHDDS